MVIVPNDDDDGYRLVQQVLETALTWRDFNGVSAQLDIKSFRLFRLSVHSQIVPLHNTGDFSNYDAANLL